VIYLVVGLDQETLTPWYANVGARDADAAKQTARARACVAGVNLVVAAVIGPNSSLVDP